MPIPVLLARSLPKIICDICNKEVEAYRMQRNPESYITEIKVQCHNSEDTCFLDDNFICEAGPLPDGRAFTTKRINREGVSDE